MIARRYGSPSPCSPPLVMAARLARRVNNPRRAFFYPASGNGKPRTFARIKTLRSRRLSAFATSARGRSASEPDLTILSSAGSQWPGPLRIVIFPYCKRRAGFGGDRDGPSAFWRWFDGWQMVAPLKRQSKSADEQIITFPL